MLLIGFLKKMLLIGFLTEMLLSAVRFPKDEENKEDGVWHFPKDEDVDEVNDKDKACPLLKDNDVDEENDERGFWVDILNQTEKQSPSLQRESLWRILGFFEGFAQREREEEEEERESVSVWVFWVWF